MDQQQISYFKHELENAIYQKIFSIVPSIASDIIDRITHNKNHFISCTYPDNNVVKVINEFTGEVVWEHPYSDENYDGIIKKAIDITNEKNKEN